MNQVRFASALSVLLIACGDSASGGGAAGGGGASSDGGAGGSGGSACTCDASGIYEDKLCFCAAVGFGCSAEITIDRVLDPMCPGSLIHPISPGCKVGGVLYPADNDLDYLTEGFYFDRDTEELVGLYASTDVQEYCDTQSATLRWGNIAASCELCDPCSATNPDYPPCPEPEQ